MRGGLHHQRCHPLTHLGTFLRVSGGVEGVVAWARRLDLSVQCFALSTELGARAPARLACWGVRGGGGVGERVGWSGRGAGLTDPRSCGCRWESPWFSLPFRLASPECPEKRVGEISQVVGFDPFYFSRQFRKRFGVSPRQWRVTNSHLNPADRPASAATPPVSPASSFRADGAPPQPRPERYRRTSRC